MQQPFSQDILLQTSMVDVNGRWQPGSIFRVMQEVSGTHAAIESEGGGLRLRDLGSTNGTTLTFGASGSSVILRGAVHTLSVGDLIDFGDGNTAVVEAAR